jgi:DNA invertase Pin-like site-specific DNA recombinase
MSSFGYARVSTADQDLTVQLDALKRAGCETIRSEKVSGSTSNRPELNTLLEFLREGDEFVVTRLDRFARSNRDLQNFVHDLKEKNVTLRVLEQNIDTSTPAGKCFFDMLAAFAEFETGIRKERQAEGIAKAKAAGKYLGRKPSIDADKVRKMKSEGLGVTAIAREMGISRVSVYRVLKAA